MKLAFTRNQWPYISFLVLCSPFDLLLSSFIRCYSSLQNRKCLPQARLMHYKAVGFTIRRFCSFKSIACLATMEVLSTFERICEKRNLWCLFNAYVMKYLYSWNVYIGLPQTFHLDVFESSSDHSLDTYAQRLNPNFTLNQLKPNRTYILHAYASNAKGRSSSLVLPLVTAALVSQNGMLT